VTQFISIQTLNKFLAVFLFRALIMIFRPITQEMLLILYRKLFATSWSKTNLSGLNPLRTSCQFSCILYYVTTLRCQTTALLLLQRLLRLRSSSYFSGRRETEQRLQEDDTHLFHQHYHFLVQFFVKELGSCQTTSWKRRKSLVPWFVTTLGEGREGRIKNKVKISMSAFQMSILVIEISV